MQPTSLGELRDDRNAAAGGRARGPGGTAATQDKLVQLDLASSAGRRAADGRVQGWRLSSCSRRMPGELVTEKRQGGHAKRVGAGESGWLVLAMRRWA